jgi:hypothetical protein
MLGCNLSLQAIAGLWNFKTHNQLRGQHFQTTHVCTVRKMNDPKYLGDAKDYLDHAIKNVANGGLADPDMARQIDAWLSIAQINAVIAVAEAVRENAADT